MRLQRVGRNGRTSRLSGVIGQTGPRVALAAAIAALNPTHYYKLDDASTTVANSGSVGGTAISAATTARAVAGPDGANYLGFAGAGDSYVPIADNNALSVGAGLTVSMLYRSDGTTNPYLISKTAATAATREWGLLRVGTELRAFTINTAGTACYQATIAGALTTDVWKLITVVFYAAAAPDIYINGVLQATTDTGPTGTPNGNTTALVYIGGFNAQGYPDGDVAHPATWPSVLTSEQITALAAAAASDGWI